MNYMLDTNTCIYLMTGNQPACSSSRPVSFVRRCGLIARQLALEMTDAGANMLPSLRWLRNQHHVITAAFDEYLVALEPEFLGQTDGLAIALLEYFGRFHSAPPALKCIHEKVYT